MARPVIPRATLRLQFHRAFTFTDATRLVPYFARLGVSHVYASPIAVARPGSTHGYDVIDPTQVNPELGGEDGLRTFAAGLRSAGLGLIVDIVPNHMAADLANTWWRDVLYRGRASRFSSHFDIDWEVDDPGLRGKVLLAVLGRPLSEALAAGELALASDSGGRPAIRYFSHLFPLAEGSAGEASTLGDILERQHYRLAWWRTAGDRINWRRFFDINELVCLRMEEPTAFDAVHALPLRLYGEGVIDGLRIDHVDGLTDPRAYCRTLRRRLDDLAEAHRRPRAYLVVEKILLRGESLAVDWQCDGTTGYDFMNDASALQHDGDGEKVLAETWAAISGRPASFAPEEQAARREIVARSFFAQLDACAASFQGLLGRELARPAFRRALAELLVHFPVYRTYGAGSTLSSEDAAVLRRAGAGAIQTCLATDRWAVAAILDALTGPTADDAAAQHRRRAVARLQQLSAPVAAKSVEDTAFYRYGRLLSRNDVGFDVEWFCLEPADFHTRVLARQTTHPNAMLATATHDHKRGEDVRARLAVLSEMAGEWTALLSRWIDASAPLRGYAGGRDAPSAGDAAMLLQTIVGAWPIDLDLENREGRAAFAERLVDWQRKALREAKLESDWAAVNDDYEAAARDLLLKLLVEATMPGLLDEIVSFVRSIEPAGAVNGLAQCLLKLTVPGVPDIYQGTEFWDFSLVDPDNRRPVDFDLRTSRPQGGLAELAANWRDGRIKQTIIMRTLALRRQAPRLFSDGAYRPVRIDGDWRRCAVAFVRELGSEWLLVVVPRLALRLLRGDGSISLSPDAWKGTTLILEGAPTGVPLYDVLGGGIVEILDERPKIDLLCGSLPLALVSTVAPRAAC
jgi:(1->4)-alpha-D-glucan 1-alpha-D-glucosylmutase